MNKGIDGLCGFIRSNLMRDPLSSEVFIFMDKNKKQIKLLRWENGRFIFIQSDYMETRGLIHNTTMKRGAII